jgi:hypothetical protein
MNTHLDTRDPPITDDGFETDSLDASRAVTAAVADHPNGGIARLEEDAGSKIQTIFFGIAGTCIGVATLVVAILALKAMPRQRQPDLESPPPTREEDRLPSGGMELAQYPNPSVAEQIFELDAVQPAENVQRDRPANLSN